MKRSAVYNAFIAFLAFMLVACGGGSDGALTLTGASPYTVTVSVPQIAGSPVGSTTNPVVSTAISPVAVTALVRSPSGAVVPNVTVTFGTTAGRLATTTATTNLAGLATASLLAGSGGPATGSITAVYVDPTGNITQATAPVATAGDEAVGTPGSTSPTIAIGAYDGTGAVSDATHPITDTAPGTLRVLVQSATGAALGNVIVTFNAGSVGTLSQTTALTDSTGRAQVTLTANTSGAATATASATIGTTTISGTTVYAGSVGGGGGGGGIGANLALVARTAGGVVVDSTNPITNLAAGTLTATLTQAGTPISGQLITFNLTGGTASLSQTSALTDTSGVAVVPISALSTGAGSATAAATVGGVAVTGSVFFSTSTGGGVADSPVITLTILDSANAAVNAGNPITSAAAGKARALVTVGGVPQANVVVTFALEAGDGATLGQTVALTDAAGVAEVPVNAGTTGAGTITSSATVNGTAISSEAPYATVVLAPPPLVLALGSLNGLTFTSGVLESNAPAAPAQIAPGTDVIITADIIDTATNSLYLSLVNVSFSSTCSTLGKATLQSPVPSVNGSATTVYVPGSCTGTDTITATVISGTQVLTATTTLSIAAEPLGSIEFESTTASDLVLKGTGTPAHPESATLAFKVLGTAGGPLVSQSVCFGLSTTVGGITLSRTSAATNSSGIATVVVNSGSIPTPLLITAFVDNDGDNNCATKPAGVLQTVSDQLTISTGLPDQKSFSVAVSNLNPLAFNLDGVEVQVTAFAADHFNNPVPDGTAISFWTELGAIGPSCLTSNGTCSVTWRSQAPRNSVDPRPKAQTGLSLQDRVGRSTILAYAVGEESFVDLNGDGLFNVSGTTELPTVLDLDEVVKDSNLNGVRDNVPGVQQEEFVDFDLSGTYNTENGIYDGVLCNAGTPSCSGRASVHVRQYSQIVMSANGIRIYVVSHDAQTDGVDFEADGHMIGIVNPTTAPYDFDPADPQTISGVHASAGGSQFSVIVTDSNGNTLASGSKVSIVIDSALGTVLGTSSYTIGQVSDPEGKDWFHRSFSLKAPAATPVSGQFQVVVELPSGLKDSVDVDIDW